MAISQDDTRGIVQGNIRSADDKQPLFGATVLLQGTVYGTTTDQNGSFIMKNIPQGSYTLTVSMIGYKRVLQSVSIQRGDNPLLAIELEPTVIQTAPVIVTANKHEQSLEEVPVSVSVVDDRTLAYRNAVTVDEALRYVPGVNITQSQVNIRGSTGYSYGVGTRVLLLVDGSPLLTGDTGEIIWESIPTVSIERIEIVKGAGSALYGSSALGGVINIITKRAAEHPETRLRLYGGVYEMPRYSEWQWSKDPRPFSGIMGTYQQHVGEWTLGFGGSRTVNDGYKRNDFWKRWNVWSRVGYDLSAFQSVDISFNLLDQRRANFLYWKDLNHALEPKDDQLFQRVQSLRWSLSGNYRYFVSSGIFATAKLSWFRSRWDDNIPNRFDPYGSNSRSDFLIGELQMNYRPASHHMVTAGINGNFNNVDADTIFGKHSSIGSALYLQDEIAIPDSIRLILGGRYDYQKVEGIDRFSQLNPKLGLVYSPTGSTSLRASLGSGFRAPSIAEAYTTTDAGGITILPNLDLRPERSLSIEIGGMHTFGSTVTTDLALFRNEFWDLIEPSFAADGYVHFQNITRARITGGEFVLRLNALKGLLPAQVSYTYVYPEDLTKNDILKYRPRHLVYVSLQGILPPFTLGADFRYISRTERIDDELVFSGTVPDGDQRVEIYVTDVRVSAELRFAGLSITSTFHVNNLFQYYYTDFIGNLGPTRNYVLSVETVFQ
ncbi:MAG: TonB-dependent receptor [Ignavibacteriae bacterium]|nr:TonB-dependent receptor [Ignavibacteriota bacterium]